MNKDKIYSMIGLEGYFWDCAESDDLGGIEEKNAEFGKITAIDPLNSHMFFFTTKEGRTNHCRYFEEISESKVLARAMFDIDVVLLTTIDSGLKMDELVKDQMLKCRRILYQTGKKLGGVYLCSTNLSQKGQTDKLK
jgi:hypothetical protein